MRASHPPTAITTADRPPIPFCQSGMKPFAMCNVVILGVIPQTRLSPQRQRSSFVRLVCERARPSHADPHRLCSRASYCSLSGHLLLFKGGDPTYSHEEGEAAKLPTLSPPGYWPRRIGLISKENLVQWSYSRRAGWPARTSLVSDMLYSHTLKANEEVHVVGAGNLTRRLPEQFEYSVQPNGLLFSFFQ